MYALSLQCLSLRSERSRRNEALDSYLNRHSWRASDVPSTQMCFDDGGPMGGGAGGCVCVCVSVRTIVCTCVVDGCVYGTGPTVKRGCPRGPFRVPHWSSVRPVASDLYGATRTSSTGVESPKTRVHGGERVSGPTRGGTLRRRLVSGRVLSGRTRGSDLTR